MRRLPSFRLLTFAVALLVASLPCFADELAVLKNGFSIRHERREVVGDVTRLYMNADGSSYVDVPTAEIEHFEAAPDLPAVTPALSDHRKGGDPAAVSQASPFFRASHEPLAWGAQPPADLNDVVSAASWRYRLDPDLVNSVIKAESDFNVRAVSPKGALGLMQLMPGTASQLGVQNAFDPQANVEGGTKYLRELLERYDFDLVKALAAYNAGPERVEQFGGVPPFYETRAYVARVVRDFNKKKSAQRKSSAQTAPATKASSAKMHTASAARHNAGPVTQAKAQPSD